MYVDFNDMTMMTRVLLLMIHGGGKRERKRRGGGTSGLTPLLGLSLLDDCILKCE